MKPATVGAASEFTTDVVRGVVSDVTVNDVNGCVGSDVTVKDVSGCVGGDVTGVVTTDGVVDSKMKRKTNSSNREETFIDKTIISQMYPPPLIQC